MSTTSIDEPDTQSPFTISYKEANGAPVVIDIYPPIFQSYSAVGQQPVPAVLYFHGGGLTVGNRRSWFPSWLKKRVVAAGFAFISADHNLIPPSTAHDIVEDIRDLFRFFLHDLNPRLREQFRSQSASSDDCIAQTFEINPHTIAVAGSSAGGLCAYLAALHASPKPIAVIAMYAMGGNFLTPHYLCPKTKVFFRGRELLDPDVFSEYLYPACKTLAPVSDSVLSYHSASHPIPGYPSNPRMLLARLYLQLGIYLDYYTGAHDPSLTISLRKALQDYMFTVPQYDSDPTADAKFTEELKHLIAEEHLSLFPQFNVTSSWPPTFLVHGSLDTAVPVQESQHMHRLLERAGIDVMLKVVDGQEHSFDYASGAEEAFGSEDGLFDEVMNFICHRLHAEK